MLKCHLRRIMADQRIDDISDLMKLSGLSRNSINKLYKDQEIETTKLETLLKLCDALNCKLSELIEYDPEDKNG